MAGRCISTFESRGGDDVHAADAIVVLALRSTRTSVAGVPGPLYHAKQLYDQGYARRSLQPDSYGPTEFSERLMWYEFLIQQESAPTASLPNREAAATRDSIRASVALMSRKLESALVVSDGFHLYRVKEC